MEEHIFSRPSHTTGRLTLCKPMLKAFLVTAGLSAQLFCSVAHAYTAANYCGNLPATLDALPLVSHRNATIPDNSACADAYFQAIRNWNDASGVQIVAGAAKSGNAINTSDSDSDIAMVARSIIPNGNNGYTSYANISWCAGSEESYYGATDTVIASDSDCTLLPPSASYSSVIGAQGGGRATFLHELGHELGLGHDNGAFNIMNDGKHTNRPSSPIGPVPFPDDAAGVSYLYGRGSLTNNVFVSGQTWDGQHLNVLDNFQTDQTVCWGDTTVIPVTAVNQKNELHYQLQFTISQDPSGANPVHSETWSMDDPAYNYVCLGFFFKTKLVVPGSYYAMFTLDPNNQVAESREDDNFLRYPGMLIVSDCNGIIPFASSQILYL